MREPLTGKRVAVVGAGPAGLSCAHGLALRGHEVTVFEARTKAGGLNEYGIAAYKMNGDRAAKEVAFILSLGGIQIETERVLGRDLSLASLRRDFDAVFLALGDNATNHLDIGHEDAQGVSSAVDFISRIRQEDLTTLPVGRHVVVIGGGNTAIDIAIQARKLGAEFVTLVYRRGHDQMGATDYEQALAQTQGVVLKTWARPHRFQIGEDGLHRISFEHTRLEPDGRLAGTGEFFQLPADQVFEAIGQHFDAALLQAEHLPAVENGSIAVDEMRRTSLPGVWAGGDCIAGPDLTVVAVQDGKIAASSIHDHLMGSSSASKEVSSG